jgi:hypothetical protein
MTVATAPRAIDRNGVTLLETGDTIAKLRDPPRILVPEREWRCEAEILFHDVEVGMAYASPGDLDDHLT